MTDTPGAYHTPKPLAVGDVLEVTIESQGIHNDGIVTRDGFVIFVKDTIKGKKYKVKIIEVKRTFANAEKV
ncbi:MAG: TRAM domain-containing protein [Candidatus Micrarchaeota archaeon]|nr:TRAM domain-containing protein [Candidatus Micrarchaeota archaeon]